MPVARSDPRRATIVGIVGVVVGTLLVVIVLFAGNLGDSKSSTTSASHDRFQLGAADSNAAAIAKDGPISFPDPLEGSRAIFVQHLGGDPNAGWVAFDAAVNGTCVLTWHQDTKDFTDCNGVRYPADGGPLHHYPTSVEKGQVFVDLNPDATSTTSTTGTTIHISGNPLPPTTSN